MNRCHLRAPPVRAEGERDHLVDRDVGAHLPGLRVRRRVEQVPGTLTQRVEVAVEEGLQEGLAVGKCR
ncbi:hypothetical protein GCM10020216_032550 [Nonomuraea helvata]